ncbi:nucleosidase [Flavobacterium faecale]|uniref:Nucleosidase n=1 Tax=Flavobacterium faecale TaxID=1355330 RepID=A0A2S1LEJ3_9FLAO|nr:nucleosidase [Flavobacterium faecale]AWG22128.1 nucleosidase [Flavobacterium faecale]
MITINQDFSFSIDNVLFVFALEMEAAKVFDNMNTLFTGIGKVNASYELTKRITTQKPDLIVNLGSAGSNYFAKGDVVCCTQFVQRDMDVRGLGYALYETPFAEGPVVLPYGMQKEGLPNGICGTGDNFEMSHAASLYNLVDMEAYALAMIAKKEGIPFLCLKYISDGADDNAAEDWPVLVHKAAVAFGAIFDLGAQ